MTAACPSWCALDPGHPYLDGHRVHTATHVGVTLRQEEYADGGSRQPARITHPGYRSGVLDLNDALTLLAGLTWACQAIEDDLDPQVSADLQKDAAAGNGWWAR